VLSEVIQGSLLAIFRQIFWDASSRAVALRETFQTTDTLEVLAVFAANFSGAVFIWAGFIGKASDTL